MSSAVTKQQYSYSNEVKFSDLRRDFAESSSGSIPFSTYYRATSLSNTNPIVPDATENTHVPTSSTISMSAFKNNTTVKRYYVTQSGTDSQLAIHGLSWNGNLDKNIMVQRKPLPTFFLNTLTIPTWPKFSNVAFNFSEVTSCASGPVD